MQADDFFNAYRVLHESHTFMIEKLEKLGGKPLINDTAFGTFPASTPSVVCLAFSVELYIKELYQVLNLEPPHSHKISQLFEKLPEYARQQIFAHASISQNPFATGGSIFSSGKLSAYERFITRLAAISNAFEKWRYSYESTTLHYESWFAIALIEAVKSVADGLKAQSAA